VSSKPTVNSPSTSGTEISFIDTDSQSNGTISATKKNVRGASASHRGIITTTSQLFAGNKTFNDALSINANKNYNWETNTNAFLVNKDLTWDSSSYYECVYLLIPVLTSKN